MSSVKEEAHRLIDRLPEEATWDDLLYEFHVKRKIEAGLKAVEEGRTLSHAEAKRRLLGDDR